MVKTKQTARKHPGGGLPVARKARKAEKRDPDVDQDGVSTCDQRQPERSYSKCM